MKHDFTYTAIVDASGWIYERVGQNDVRHMFLGYMSIQCRTCGVECFATTKHELNSLLDMMNKRDCYPNDKIHRKIELFKFRQDGDTCGMIIG